MTGRISWLYCSETTVAEQKKAMDELTKELEKAKKDLNKATEELWRRNGDENDRWAIRFINEIMPYFDIRNLAINDLLDRIEEMAVEKATLRVKIEELEKENDSLEDKITSHVKNMWVLECNWWLLMLIQHTISYWLRSHLEEWINVSLNCREDEEREIYKRGWVTVTILSDHFHYSSIIYSDHLSIVKVVKVWNTRLNWRVWERRWKRWRMKGTDSSSSHE